MKNRYKKLKGNCSQMFYLKTKTFSPFTNVYAYLDVPEYYADTLFIKHKIKVKFLKEAIKKDEKYVIVICKIHKKNSAEFEKVMDELEKKMLLLGKKDYIEKCEEFKNMLEEKID